jgi:hypothetical protein
MDLWAANCAALRSHLFGDLAEPVAPKNYQDPAGPRGCGVLEDRHSWEC